MSVIGSWSQALEPGKQATSSHLNSNQVETRDEIQYSKEDIAHIEKWGTSSSQIFIEFLF